MLWIIFTIAICAIAYYLIIMRPYKYWIDRNVVQDDPIFPFGDNWRVVLRKESFADVVSRVYNPSLNTRYSGMYQNLQPTLVLRDPDLIKQITVKDFDHFLDHRTFVPEDIDPIWSNNLFALTGQRWRDMRSNLSPAFTSSKMKYMFTLIKQSGKQFTEYFLKQDKDIVELEMKDTLTRFTNDVIANTAFGITCDSLTDRDNEFYLMGKAATDFTGVWRTLKLFLMITFPSIGRFTDGSFIPTKVAKFFTNIVKINIENREKEGIVRPDMIHLLLKARKEGLKHEESNDRDAGFATVQESEIGKAVPKHKRELTDLDITSQALIFFFAGFDSVSSAMCFMSYELALNPDVQEKLIAEVDETETLCGGDVTYEAISNMKYMDMVVCETLRKWPAAVAADRVCTKPYTIEPKNPGELPIHFKVNDVLWLPIYGIQHDPKYWPEPEKFDPERFNEENKTKIMQNTYIPFGAGPRNCIGSRFALLETKILFFHILSKFEIVKTEKTQIPLQLNRKSFSMTAENGFQLALKRRKKKLN